METKQFTLTTLAALSISVGSLQAELVSYFTFDNHLNNTVAGQSNGTITGNESYVTGKFGKAIALQVAGNHVDLGSRNLGAIGKGDFSISLWVNLNGQTVSGDPAFFSNKNWDSGINKGINYALHGGGKLDINTYGNERIDWDDEQTPETILSRGGNNLILTRSGNNLSYYLNGNLVSTKTITAGANFKSAMNFVLGEDGQKAYNKGSHWSGTLLFDNLSIYNTALTAAEVKQLQTAATLPQPSSAVLLGIGRFSLILQQQKNK